VEDLLCCSGIPTVKEINVAAPDFFKELSKLVVEEKIDNLKLYLRWQQLHAAAMGLSKPFVEESFAFYSKRLTGTDKILPRWKRCVGFADHAMGEALGTSFVSKTFGDDGKAKALEIIHGIEVGDGAERQNAEPGWTSRHARRRWRSCTASANKIGFPGQAS
jgi:putative endopeptidase